MVKATLEDLPEDYVFLSKQIFGTLKPVSYMVMQIAILKEVYIAWKLYKLPYRILREATTLKSPITSQPQSSLQSIQF